VDRGSSDDDADRIAWRVVEALRDQERANARGLLKSDEAASLLGVDAEWVRAHQTDLGAVKLGDGPKARLRFPREAIDAYLAARKVRGSARADAPPGGRARRARRPDVSPPSLAPRGQAVMDW
jgi:hypothetical protein